MIITKQMMEDAKTEKGGYTGEQVKYAQSITGRSRGWRKAMVGECVPDGSYERFKALGESKKKKCKAGQKALNSFPRKHDGWAWKPTESDIPELRFPAKPETAKTRKKAKKKRRDRVKQSPDSSFYLSREWRALRYRVLRKFGARCQCCGKTAADGVRIHVDHIKPRSKYPDLSLAFENLQVLCDDCNIGKSNKFTDDWRPVSSQ